METHAGYCVGESAGRLTSKGTITPEKPGRGYARRGGSGVRRGLTAGYNLLQIIEDIFVGAFAHGRGDLCVENTNFPSIFLFPKFQRTISGFYPEKCVPFLKFYPSNLT